MAIAVETLLYQNRGDSKQATGDIDGAFADMNQAIGWPQGAGTVD